MSDYTITTDFSVKDSLPDKDPEKLILGADLDVEFEAIVVAIATKFDSADIATQVQAEAGVSNSVLMTPLRTAQLLANAGGGGAGIVGDLIDLADPGADRILFWDDSLNTTAFLTVGSGLSISGVTLSADPAAVDHDALLNFVANEHIDHTAVEIATAATGGLTGGGDISATRNLALDFSGLTQETTIDAPVDVIAFYDDSAAAMRKVPIDSIVGAALGDAKFYRNTTQSITSTLSTLVFNTAAYNNLQKGTYSTSTGEYTVGSSDTRLQVDVNLRIDAQAEAESMDVEIQVNGVPQQTFVVANLGQFGASGQTGSFGTNLNLAATDVVRVQAKNTTTKNLLGGAAVFNINFTELA